MLRKIFYSMFFALLMVSVFATTSFADTHPEKVKTEVIYKAKELKDENKLFKKAKNGETDLVEEKLPEFANVEAVLKSNNKARNSNKKSELKKVEVYTTTQLLKVEKKDGKKIKTYVTNNFAVPTNAQLSTRSDPDSKYDTSYSVKAQSTVYYTTSFYNGRIYYDMSRISGSWSILDSSVTVGGYRIKYGQIGLNKSGYTVNQTSNYKFPGQSFSLYVPSSWQPVWASDSYSHSIGVNSWCSIERGGSQWTLTLYNRI